MFKQKRNHGHHPLKLPPGVVIRNTTLTASRPIDDSSSTDGDISSSQRNSAAVAAATRVNKRRKVQKTFDERFKDLMTFKAECGHCNAPLTQSSSNKHYSLRVWCRNVRRAYEAIKEGGIPTMSASRTLKYCTYRRRYFNTV